MQRATIVYNPRARNAPSLTALSDAAAALRHEGWEIDMLATVSAGHATVLAREAAVTGADVVFACGGDGTVNEVVNGLARSESALGLIRGGMGNVFAKEVGVPRAPEEALKLLIAGERRRFDLGLAGERYFLLMAGIGFDAMVVARVPQRPKRILGSTAYVLWGAFELVRHQSSRVSVRIDGQEEMIDLYWAVLGNTRSYAGVLEITGEAQADDGLLDAYLFTGQGKPWVLRTAVRLILGRHKGAGGVSFRRVRELEVDAPGIPVQADGEYFGETPMRFSIVPQALTVLMPPGEGAHLFANVGEATDD